MASALGRRLELSREKVRLLAPVGAAAGLAAAFNGPIASVLVQADARALPFPGAHFDLVWSSYFLDLFPTGELLPLPLEFRRILQPPGSLLLVNLSRKKDEGITRWERAYQLTPSWLVPYPLGGCRPTQAVPFVREAGWPHRY